MKTERVQVVRCSRCRHALAVVDEHEYVTWTRWGRPFREAPPATSSGTGARSRSGTARDLVRRVSPPWGTPRVNLQASDRAAAAGKAVTLEELIQAHLEANPKCATLGRVAVDYAPRLFAKKGGAR